ncbi:CDP-glycerol--UDP-pyrophosphoryl-N-acetylglucosaminyl-N-acetylmannosamine glycerophosphotransferase [Sansalvadorimonas sp. 2012CJ34-2]|uniref:CDP-glycerol--UDP-pyrophosphoryl-N-acetylglucosaminyl-N-acetylmannosamine glycerophosphotransferase n=1 Tax=Parendozoicomonas callyspongiae TaxID=2942213 RepID=A0ABT0PFK9_9GAMM|nr:SulA-like leucine-rich domain-containing protein [Sansalvadorimonas sp. 2012CJ34-2]MCL6269801.1 CDP-glycerol--UDP-pyrophosphoryl-N-acetylglucosaminyl-N-acetylmannosamine glycerophosphotransferase [Sansalvadorimonas sp. 2012CJ34-2]
MHSFSQNAFPFSQKSESSPDTGEDIMVEERISEVILPSLGFSMAALIAPMLTQLSRSQDLRWLTLICTTSQATDIAQWLKTTGVVINKLLLLSAEDSEGCLELGKKALAAGTSHTVVTWLNPFTTSALAQLENAAQSGNSAGIVIRQRKAH